MKRLIFVFVIAFLLVFSGCDANHETPSVNNSGDVSNSITPSTSAPASETSTQSDGLTETLNFGTFITPEGWHIVPSNSEYIWYYAKEGTEESETASYIALEYVETDYEASEHEILRDIILQSLLEQTAQDASELTGEGTYTDQDYFLYIFTITKQGDPTIYKNYIIGDYQILTVNVIDYQDVDTADVQEAADTIVNSFVWN